MIKWLNKDAIIAYTYFTSSHLKFYVNNFAYKCGREFLYSSTFTKNS